MGFGFRSRNWVALAALSVACGGISTRRGEGAHGGQAGGATGGNDQGGSSGSGAGSGGVTNGGTSAGGTSAGGTNSPGTGGFPSGDAGQPAACGSPLEPGCAACCEPYDRRACRVRSSASGTYYDQYELTEWECVPECPSCNLCDGYDNIVETIIYAPDACRADCDCKTVDRNGDPCFDYESCGCYCTWLLNYQGNCLETFHLCE